MKRHEIENVPINIKFKKLTTKIILVLRPKKNLFFYFTSQLILKWKKSFFKNIILFHFTFALMFIKSHAYFVLDIV